MGRSPGKRPWLRCFCDAGNFAGLEAALPRRSDETCRIACSFAVAFFLFEEVAIVFSC
jgi:hypothetical protein